MKFFTALISFAAAIRLQDEAEELIAGLQADCAADKLDAETCTFINYCAENRDDPECVAAADEFMLGGEVEGPEREGPEAGEEEGPEDGEGEQGIEAHVTWCRGEGYDEEGCDFVRDCADLYDQGGEAALTPECRALVEDDDEEEEGSEYGSEYGTEYGTDDEDLDVGLETLVAYCRGEGADDEDCASVVRCADLYDAGVEDEECEARAAAFLAGDDDEGESSWGSDADETSDYDTWTSDGDEGTLDV